MEELKMSEFESRKIITSEDRDYVVQACLGSATKVIFGKIKISDAEIGESYVSLGANDKIDINLNKTELGENIYSELGTLIHELGHVLDERMMPVLKTEQISTLNKNILDKWQEWEDVRKSEKSSLPSAYDERDVFEDRRSREEFANLVADYILKNNELKEKNPKRLSFLEKHYPQLIEAKDKIDTRFSL